MPVPTLSTPSTRSRHSARTPARVAAVVAGTGLLLMAVLAAAANFGVVERLVTPGDAARTAADVGAAPGLFAAAVAAMAVVAVLDVVVALALHALLRPPGPRLSAVAAGLRVVFAAVLAAALVRLAAVPGLVDAPDDALRAAADFTRVWDAGLLLFGAHLVVLAAAAHRARVVPRLVVVLVAVAGVGYLADAASVLLAPDRPLALAQVLFVGEVALMVWLLVAGGRRPVAGAVAADPVRPGRPVAVGR